MNPNTTAVKFEAELQVRLTEELRAGGLVQETYTRMPLRTRSGSVRRRSTEDLRAWFVGA